MLCNEKKNYSLYDSIYFNTNKQEADEKRVHSTSVNFNRENDPLEILCILNPLTQFFPESESADYLIRIERIFLILLFDLSLKWTQL